MKNPLISKAVREMSERSAAEQVIRTYATLCPKDFDRAMEVTPGAVSCSYVDADNTVVFQFKYQIPS